jgi:phage shock protein A
VILESLWRVIRSQINKLANFFWASDPLALMQAEYDSAVAQLREGRLGLEQYRAFVERVGRQVARQEAQARMLEATVKTYLQSGDRETAARFALELQRARKDLEENRAQLLLHEQAYENHLLKIKHAGGKLAEIRSKIVRYDAELKMSAAEAEMAKVAQDLNFDVTTDFGQIEQTIQEKIDLNRARVRVAVDMSEQGLDTIREEEAAQSQLADDALKEFESQLGTEAIQAGTHGESPAKTVTGRRKVIEGS